MTVDRAMNVVVTIAVLALVAIAARRELGVARTDPMDPDAPPVAISEWHDLLDTAVPIKVSPAGARIVVFEDMQCPFCRHFQLNVLDSLEREYPHEISVYFVHFPIPGHGAAHAAARAVECAAAQGIADEVVDSIFSRQSRLDSEPLLTLVADVPWPDRTQMEACLTDTSSIERVERGIALGKEMRVPGTPTVVIDGMLYSRPPDLVRLRAIMDSTRRSAGVTSR